MPKLTIQFQSQEPKVQRKSPVLKKIQKRTLETFLKSLLNTNAKAHHLIPVPGAQSPKKESGPKKNTKKNIRNILKKFTKHKCQSSPSDSSSRSPKSKESTKKNVRNILKKFTKHKCQSSPSDSSPKN